MRAVYMYITQNTKAMSSRTHDPGFRLAVSRNPRYGKWSPVRVSQIRDLFSSCTRLFSGWLCDLDKR